MKNILVHAVMYKEKEDDMWTIGVRIGEDGLIVDLEGNTIREIWDVETLLHKGCFNMTDSF